MIDKVRKTGRSIRTTRLSKPVADIVPIAAKKQPPVFDRAAWIGSMKGSVKILGDIISPASDPDEWEVFRD